MRTCCVGGGCGHPVGMLLSGSPPFSRFDDHEFAVQHSGYTSSRGMERGRSPHHTKSPLLLHRSVRTSLYHSLPCVGNCSTLHSRLMCACLSVCPAGVSGAGSGSDAVPRGTWASPRCASGPCRRRSLSDPTHDDSRRGAYYICSLAPAGSCEVQQALMVLPDNERAPHNATPFLLPRRISLVMMMMGDDSLSDHNLAAASCRRFKPADHKHLQLTNLATASFRRPSLSV